MKHSLTVPAGVSNIVAISGLVLVVMLGIGIPAFFPNWVIPVIGAFIGLFCVRDPKMFLIAGLSIVAAKWGLRYVPFVGGYTYGIANQLIGLIAPAMLVVSVRSIYHQIRG